MSQALASARKRRAPASALPEPVPVPQQTSKTAGTTSGLTLPQVIALIDKRLVALEQFMGDAKIGRSEPSVQNKTTVDSETVESV